MKRQKEQVIKIFNYLIEQDIIEEDLTLSFSTDRFTFYSPYNLVINMDWKEMMNDYTARYAHLEYLFHEIGHHIHHIHFEDDFNMKAELKEASYDYINTIEDWEEQCAAYRQLPLEVEADRVGEILFKQIKEDWQNIFGTPFTMEQIIW